ncbi:D-alanyl-D-alanine carboxypeptidase [Salinibacterium sp. SYSU T00001]|uniref:D-alanyl-D-alanine carboxypeptidase n=1 Tax=Homoserinimonas sedimenticola TaxID=2986805 RepID=UPI0022364EA8|nr:D-alanyl-D-alanine carboxypeptidase [Salinibacterium sedimenticola]MCW4385153.1 D-alanyl-D-alanine carboxypeptidase [Salinibacterium sedimenticola]
MNSQETPSQPGGADATGSARSRVSEWLVSRPRAVLVAGAVLVVAALGAGAVAAGASASRGPVASVTAATAEELEPRIVPEVAAAPARARSCVVDASDPAFAELSASVVNVATGEQLYARGGADKPVSALSLHKLMTAAVALHVLGPETRIPTRVYEGSVAGTIVLQAGGDATLSAVPAGAESVYPGAPKLSDLAAQTKASLDRLYPGESGDDDDDGARRSDDGDDTDDAWFWNPFARGDSGPDWEITEVVVDTRLWGASDAWDPAWPAEERTTGTQARIVPLMVDGDRQDATLVTSPRSEDPAGAATAAFVTALDLPSAPRVTQGSAITDRPLLAEVYSQPVSVLVQQMLHLNDHTLADMLARLSSARVGNDGSAASLQQLYESVLSQYGIPASGIVAADGSGLNPASAVAPEYVARLLSVAVSGDATLRYIHLGLPVAGVSGPLLHRFSGDFATVHSVFGGIGAAGESATSLGGLLTAADGTILALSLQSIGDVTSATGLALESFVVAAHACGDNLAAGKAPSGG